KLPQEWCWCLRSTSCRRSDSVQTRTSELDAAVSPCSEASAEYQHDTRTGERQHGHDLVTGGWQKHHGDALIDAIDKHALPGGGRQVGLVGRACTLKRAAGGEQEDLGLYAEVAHLRRVVANELRGGAVQVAAAHLVEAGEYRPKLEASCSSGVPDRVQHDCRE